MFRIDRTANRLSRLDRTSFSEVGFREREHLQEWLASMPECLGETLGDELLIIQKEFDGFEGTRERLDLLALDGNGQLMVIENKLDDSGRDVVWQALKYAAYCSSLKKTEIVDVFQKHLNMQGGGDAATAICEFLGEDSLDEVVLNDGTGQRVVFVAANFRREVTSTVLWLRDHQIDVRCIKLIPYKYNDEIFVDLQQVIPTAEAADYMIRMAAKDSEEKSAQGAQRRSHQLRLGFWERALDVLRERGSPRFQNVGPSKDNWLSIGAGLSGCSYNVVFLKGEARVDLVMQRLDAGENKWIFDELESQKADIESRFGESLNWNRHNQAKRCVVNYGKEFNSADSDNWPEIAEWMAEHVRRFEDAFRQPLDTLNQRLKSSERKNS